MTLTEVASDLFLFLVTFRRQVRKGLTPDPGQVRQQLLDILEEQQRRARDDANLEKLYEKARYPLVVTADEILINSNWTYSAQWEDEILEYDYYKTRIAGEQFFSMIEDLGDAEEELAEVFYICLCLGFVGRYKNDAEELRRLKRRLYRMVPGRIRDDEKRLTPDAYYVAEGTTDIIKPLVNLGRILIICGTIFVIIWVGFFIYRTRIIPSNIKKYAAEMREVVAVEGTVVADDDDEDEDEAEEDEDKDDDEDKDKKKKKKKKKKKSKDEDEDEEEVEEDEEEDEEKQRPGG